MFTVLVDFIGGRSTVYGDVISVTKQPDDSVRLVFPDTGAMLCPTDDPRPRMVFVMNDEGNTVARFGIPEPTPTLLDDESRVEKSVRLERGRGIPIG